MANIRDVIRRANELKPDWRRLLREDAGCVEEVEAKLWFAASRIAYRITRYKYLLDLPEQGLGAEQVAYAEALLTLWRSRTDPSAEAQLAREIDAWAAAVEEA